MFERLRQKLGEPVDASSLAVFRVIFGLAIAVGVARYIGYGWVDELYIQPDYHFTYWGFDWVQPWPGEWMYVHYAVMGLLGIFIAVGLFYRASVASFFVLFTYTELIDKTAYLNHYYLISLLALLMIFMPLGRYFSLDALRDPDREEATVPAWTLWTLRLQIGLVYFFAGVAKLRGDWLVDGEPMGIWLAARTDFWLVGSLFDQAWLGNAMSIAGCVFDLTVFFFLLWPTTRLFAYLAVVVFHTATGLLFNIGLFPVIMIGLTPIFFEPDWPRQLLAKVRSWLNRRSSPVRSASVGSKAASSISRGLLVALAVWFSIQLFLPLRHWLYPGDVHWNHQGWRASWRVMLVEKSGHLKYELYDPNEDRRWMVYPSEFLTARQLQVAAGSPDMILQLAHDLPERYDSENPKDVEVYAEGYVSLNGRPSQPITDPTVDLTEKPRGFVVYDWVVPLEE